MQARQRKSMEQIVSANVAAMEMTITKKIKFYDKHYELNEPALFHHGQIISSSSAMNFICIFLIKYQFSPWTMINSDSVLDNDTAC